MLMITKNLVMKFQNLVMNHESQPVKSNPDDWGLGVKVCAWPVNIVDHGM